MAAGRIIIPNCMPALDINGNPVSGAKLTFYVNETTTLLPVYTTSALSVAHPNPISADAAGAFASIFADTAVAYSVAVTDADNAPIAGLRNRDNVMASLFYGDDYIDTAALKANNLSDLADAAEARENLGSTTVGDAVFIAADAASARLAIGAVIGSDVQAYDPDLSAIAALTSAADKMPYSTGAQTWALADLTSFARTLLATASNSAFLVALGQIASTAIGYLSTLTGGVTRTLQSKLNDEVNVRDLGCLVDGSTNDTTAFAAAITNAAATKRTLVIPAGASMKINGAVSNASTFVSIRGEPGAIIDMSGGGSLILNPGITALPALAADITPASATVTFATAHGLVAGDVFMVWNPTDYSQAPFRAEYHSGRMFIVSSVTSSTAVVVFGTPRRTFASGSFNTYKINGGRCSLSNFEVIPNTAMAVPFQLDGFSGVKVQDVTIRSGSSDTALDIYRCFDFEVTKTRSAALVADAYPVVIANCQKGVISDLTGVYSRRHCVAIGGRSGTGTVPTADVLISGCILENISSNGIGAADIHGGCVDITYDNCIMEGAVIGGVNPTIRNSTIYGRPTGAYADGTCIVSSELVGGVYTLENNRFMSFGDGSSYGMVWFDISQRTEAWTLVMRNNTLVNPNTPVRGIHIAVGDASPPAFAARVEVDGFAYVGGTLTQLLSLGGLNDVSTTMSGSLVNVTGTITTPLGASINANYGVPVSFPKAAKGLKVRGDADATLVPRVDLETQLWSTTLTNDRFITLTNTGGASHGDRFHIIRTAGGSTRVLQVLGTNLWPGMSATVVYQGSAGGLGSWIVESLGSLSTDTGWTAGTGTPSKGAFAAYAGQNVSAAYVEAEAQATDDAVKAVSQRLLALEQAALNRILSA